MSDVSSAGTEDASVVELRECIREGCGRPLDKRRTARLCSSCEYLRRKEVRALRPPGQRSKPVPVPANEAPAPLPYQRSPVPEQIINLDHALRELATARIELLQVPEGLVRYKRKKATLEPMSRLDLVVRFLDGIMRRNGWRVGDTA